eukprot:jgi/Bigna1/18887/gw1.38.5.1
MSGFERLGVMPQIIRALEEMGWLLQTPVQDEAIPLILGGGDVMIAAETGSGKTGAFGIPVLQIVYETLKEHLESKGRHGGKGGGGQASSSSKHLSTTPLMMATTKQSEKVAIGPSGVVCQSRAMGRRDWFGVRANTGLLRGRYYFEVTVKDDGLSRVGVSSINSSLNVGTDGASFGFGGTGMKSHKGNYEKYGTLFSKNDTIGCMVDRSTSHSISFTKNGELLGEAFKIPRSLSSEALFPAVVLKNAEVEFNFGPNVKNLPSGFSPVSQLVSSSPSDGLASAAEGKAGGGEKRPEYDGRSPLCLILEPTRELAEQVFKEITKFKKHLSLPKVKHALFVGGGNFGQLIRTLKEGVQIAVGTIGTVKSLVNKNQLRMKHCRFFVLDEADQLIRDNGDKDIVALYNQIIKAPDTQVERMQCCPVVVSSATLHSKEILSLADRITCNPTWVDLKGKDSVPETVDHVFVKIDPKRKKGFFDPKLTRYITTDGVHKKDSRVIVIVVVGAGKYSETIKQHKVLMLKQCIDTFKMQQCIIFVRTQLDADNLESFLVKAGGGRRFGGRDRMGGKENPYSCVALHGGKRPHERKDNLEAFKDGLVRFLICTDVAARGIDIKELPYVINLTLPAEAEDYIHRIGRVGRADAVGLAISLVATEQEKVCVC